MMSMETTKRVWQARLDPRRNTPSIGIYSHVKDRWGIFHAQPFVLNERQAGVAIEGVIRQEKLETSQLAVDTHGYTDFAMSHARLLGFDLCPRLKELKQRHLFVPRGTKVPAEIAAVCEANVDVALIEKHWDSLVHLAASVMSGHASAVAALARFGSAAQGDPIYEAGVQLGRLLRTAFWLTTLSRTLSGTSCAGCSIGARLLTPSSAPFIPAGSARRRPNVSMKCRLWPMR